MGFLKIPYLGREGEARDNCGARRRHSAGENVAVIWEARSLRLNLTTSRGILKRFALQLEYWERFV